MFLFFGLSLNIYFFILKREAVCSITQHKQLQTLQSAIDYRL